MGTGSDTKAGGGATREWWREAARRRPGVLGAKRLAVLIRMTHGIWASRLQPQGLDVARIASLRANWQRSG